MRLQVMNPILASLRPPKRCLPMILILLFPCSTAVLPNAQQVAQPKDQTQDRKEGFGGSFKSLNPEQQKLIADMVQAYARTTKTQLDPEKVYDGARQSVRSTFDAVTHALWNS